MSEQMRFGCLTKKGCAEVRYRDIPELGANQVLIRNLTCNICTTDYGHWLGLREHQGYPMAGGHEGSGIVEAVGTNVKMVKPGDFVATICYKGCGVCEHCRKGEVSMCLNPPKIKSADGYLGKFGFSSHAVRDEEDIILMNAELDPACAGFLEPLSTVMKGLRRLRLQPLETVVVIGAGTMGILNALAARAKGARVIVTELMEKKINLAKELGFEVVDSGKEDPVVRVKEMTNGKGADCVIVAVGLTIANKQALEIVKQKDGRILQFAAAYPAPELNIDSNVIHYRRLELIGTYGADYQDFEDAAKMLNYRLVDVSKLVEAERFPLTEIQKAFQAAATPGMYRVCVECQK